MIINIGPNDMLTRGTRVRVGNDYGFIEEANIVPASNGGLITVHTVRLTAKYVRKSGAAKSALENITPYSKRVNYSFIQVLEQA